MYGVHNAQNINDIFMSNSTCSAVDFFHPEYARICKMMGKEIRLHRKQWEWVYIIYQLMKGGVIEKNKRGLVFGVGTEPLPAVFAGLGCNITATDAPELIGIEAEWIQTSQFSNNLDKLYCEKIIDEKYSMIV
jgi:hypothetical protein